MAIMRVLPNMAVVAVCDAAEMKSFMDVSLDWPHPIYIRLAKGRRSDRELGKKTLCHRQGRSDAQGGDPPPPSR